MSTPAHSPLVDTPPPGQSGEAQPATLPDAPLVRPPGAWFAVWTRSRHEARVFRHLQAKSIDVFLPTITRWSRWKDRKKRVDWPLFPGYCFVRIGELDGRAVVTCPGVVSLVATDGKPTPVPDAEIDAIRLLLASELDYDSCPLIKVGQLVEVVAGPLRGVVGRLLRKGAHARLVLSVHLIGQAVSVQIDASDVRPY